MFLARVSELIESRGITKNKLFLETGINTNAFNNWEKRGNIPSGDIVAKLADYFHVSTDYLLGRTDDPRPVGEEKEPTPVAGGGSDEKTQHFMSLVDKLTPDQQQLLLAQLQAWTGQNGQLSPVVPKSNEKKEPESDL